MKISMICFSTTGAKIGERLFSALAAQGEEVSLDKKSRYLADSIEEPLGVWAGEKFTKSDALIFIGACGIAVRAIAPHVASKKSDPAVLVIDECGKFVISLLSGHLGGANALAARAAKILGAVPVITTATDLHGQFAVDVFAKVNGCAILRMSAAKEVSAALLIGEKVGFYSEFPWEGELPAGLVACGADGVPLAGGDSGKEISYRGESRQDALDGSVLDKEAPDGAGPGETVPERGKPLSIGIAVTIHRDCLPFSETTHVVPPAVALGMGCRRGKEFAAILRAAEDCLRQCRIYQEAVAGLFSIDLKKEEAGLRELAKSWEIPFVTFTEAELFAVPGEFTSSEFVKKTTGVDNICERSAVLGSGGHLLQRKLAGNGVTAALAIKDWRIRFDK